MENNQTYHSKTKHIDVQYHFVRDMVEDKNVVGQLRGGVNQLLPCLNNYASFKIFTRNSMMITIMQRNKQRHIQHQSHT